MVAEWRPRTLKRPIREVVRILHKNESGAVLKREGAVPVLDHVQSVVDLAPDRLVRQTAAEKADPDGRSQFRQRLVGRVLDVIAGGAPQDHPGGRDSTGRRRE